MEPQKRKVVIMGSGSAGLTAGLYTARANLAPLVLEGHEAGGQLTLTTEVENFPGFPEGVMGPDLMANMRKQAERFGAEIVRGSITAADLSSRPFRLVTDSGPLLAEAFIIASGASARMLGLDTEKQLIGRGVSTCATCDGFFFRDRKLLVVGGGDSAMEEAIFLTKFASSVTVVHRRDALRASKVMQDRARKHDKIDFLWNRVIVEVKDPAQNKVVGAVLKDTKTGKTEEVACDGIFVAIGHIPNTKIFEGQLETNENGYLITHDGPRTSIPGVFAAGDVQDWTYRQAITAAGSGCMAAIDAERFLESQEGA
jgi:thioredoxin reductase (NADPH)